MLLHSDLVMDQPLHDMGFFNQNNKITTEKLIIIIYKQKNKGQNCEGIKSE
jgi:hypothetical protein